MEETIIESDIALLTESLLSSANNSTLYADTLDKISSLETQLANVYDTTVTVYLYRFVIVMSYFLLVSKVLILFKKAIIIFIKVIGAIIIFSESRKFSEPSKTNPNHMNKSEIKGNKLYNIILYSIFSLKNLTILFLSRKQHNGAFIQIRKKGLINKNLINLIIFL